MTGEQRAFVSDASGKKETAPQAHMQDKCFLCSQQIGEADPRQFYTGPKGDQVGNNVMMLAHTGCLNRFMANGEVWPGNDTDTTPAPKVADLGDQRRVMHGNATFTYSPYHINLTCHDKIATHGLKAVIPDLIVALRAAEETL